MMVTWVTMATTNYTIVEYNKIGFPLTLRATGSITKFTDAGSEHIVRYIHRVTLTGLVPGQRYGRSCHYRSYLPISQAIFSEILHFNLPNKVQTRGFGL